MQQTEKSELEHTCKAHKREVNHLSRTPEPCNKYCWKIIKQTINPFSWLKNFVKKELEIVLQWTVIKMLSMLPCMHFCSKYFLCLLWVVIQFQVKVVWGIMLKPWLSSPKDGTISGTVWRTRKYCKKMSPYYKQHRTLLPLEMQQN